MGRIYDVNPGPGERLGRGKMEIYLGECSDSDGWIHLPFVTRIEFDDDADEGEAIVTTWAARNGVIRQDSFEREPMKVVYRARVRFAFHGLPDMPETVEPLVVEA